MRIQAFPILMDSQLLSKPQVSAMEYTLFS